MRGILGGPVRKVKRPGTASPPVRRVCGMIRVKVCACRFGVSGYSGAAVPAPVNGFPMKASQIPALIALVAGCVFAAGDAGAQGRSGGRTQVGVLNCDVSAGIGRIIGSTRALTCRFRPYRGRTEFYRGTIRHAGLDIGVTRRGVMVWGVLAPSNRRNLALGGRYAGAAAEVTAGLGLGANVLIGGFEDSVALQPLSVTAQTGLNIAVGVAELTLAPIAQRRR